MRNPLIARLNLVGSLVAAYWWLTFAAADGRAESPPHPAVVRVEVPERGGASFGSGTLVDVRGQYGLVLTNWHVVRDAAQPPRVVFPDGFRSQAKVVKADADWDLAALAIWRPNVNPVGIADRAPQNGDWLAIAGYGRGDYRIIAGRCTQYVAPGMNLPAEMVELSAMARQGDSGGPILNAQGKLAGVLFGAGFGTTAGSYCGRVRRFLDGVLPADPIDSQPANDLPVLVAEAPALPDGLAMSAQDTATTTSGWKPAPTRQTLEQPRVEMPQPRQEQAANLQMQPSTTIIDSPPADAADSGNSSSFAADIRPVEIPEAPAISSPALAPVTRTDVVTWADIAGASLFEQAKTVLAAVGLVLLIACLVRRHEGK